jgi:hypothetical protein
MLQLTTMAINRAERFRILKRDNFTCRYCGKKASEEQLHVDHVRPRILGGKDSDRNLVAACRPCNIGKGGIPLTPRLRSKKVQQKILFRIDSFLLNKVRMLGKKEYRNTTRQLEFIIKEYFRGNQCEQKYRIQLD